MMDKSQDMAQSLYDMAAKTDYRLFIKAEAMDFQAELIIYGYGRAVWSAASGGADACIEDAVMEVLTQYDKAYGVTEKE